MDWLILVVIAFLSPGAIALATMFVTVAAGGADVLMVGKPQALRLSAIGGSICLVGAAWAMMIVWIRSLSELEAVDGMALAAVAAIVAATPPVLLAYQTKRSQDVDAQVTAVICISGGATALFALGLIVLGI